MHITVKLMGTLKAKQPPEPLELSDGAAIADVLRHVGIDATSVQICTVNGRLEHNRDRVLAEGDELTLIPPVGGG